VSSESSFFLISVAGMNRNGFIENLARSSLTCFSFSAARLESSLRASIPFWPSLPGYPERLQPTEEIRWISIRRTEFGKGKGNNEVGERMLTDEKLVSLLVGVSVVDGGVSSRGLNGRLPSIGEDGGCSSRMPGEDGADVVDLILENDPGVLLLNTHAPHRKADQLCQIIDL
jgi:hypothetical protein